jgi:Tfp pilus assembly protein FimV
MEDLNKTIEQKANELINDAEKNVKKNEVFNIIDDKVKNSGNLKEAIDFYATATALKQEETLNKIVDEKQEELRIDAETKRVQSETDRILKETEKIKQEKEKQLAELDKEIASKKKEVEKLQAESDKAKSFFESNEDILSCIGIRSKKSTKVMYMLMIQKKQYIFAFLFSQYWKQL